MLTSSESGGWFKLVGAQKIRRASTTVRPRDGGRGRRARGVRHGKCAPGTRPGTGPARGTGPRARAGEARHGPGTGPRARPEHGPGTGRGRGRGPRHARSRRGPSRTQYNCAIFIPGSKILVPLPRRPKGPELRLDASHNSARH